VGREEADRLNLSPPGADRTFVRKRLHLALIITTLGLSAACSSGSSQVVTAHGGPAAGELTTTTAGTAEPSTTTSEPARATTAPPSTSTTVAAPTTTTTRVVPKPTTTTTTFPASAVRLTIKNEFPRPVDVTVNGAAYHLRVGEVRGPVPVEPKADRNDTYTVVMSGTNCGLGDAGPHFQSGAGTSVTLRVVTFVGGGCDPAAGVPNIGVAWEGAWSGAH
jgi:hypothetical protein